jgi:hypothetical protein
VRGNRGKTWEGCFATSSRRRGWGGRGFTGALTGRVLGRGCPASRGRYPPSLVRPRLWPLHRSGEIQIMRGSRRGCPAKRSFRQRGVAYRQRLDELDRSRLDSRRRGCQYLNNGLDLEDLDDEVETFPEIDGCTEENVGWMKVCYQDLVPLLYSSLMDNNAFEELYVRPPGIRAW